MKTAFIYCRVATHEQLLENSQLAALKAFADDQDLDIIATLAESGCKSNYDQKKTLGYLQSRIEQTGADILLVQSVDRLSRNVLTIDGFLKSADEAGFKVYTPEGEVKSWPAR